jgi:hypothetical protein
MQYHYQRALPSHVKESFPRLLGVLAHRSSCSTDQAASTTPLSFRVHQYRVLVLTPSFSSYSSSLRDVSARKHFGSPPSPRCCHFRSVLWVGHWAAKMGYAIHVICSAEFPRTRLCGNSVNRANQLKQTILVLIVL